jgi:uncharacterized phage-associated protein
MPGRPEFSFNERRFKDVMLHAAEKLADDPTFGETKLNKILYFIDFEGFRLLGQPITGAEYQKNKFGPTARLYTIMRDELIRRDAIEVKRRLVADHVQDVVTLKPEGIRANMDQFSDEERALIDSVIEKMREYNNREVSDNTHERSAGWRAMKMGRTIPYSSAIIDPTPLNPDQLKKLQTLLAESA